MFKEHNIFSKASYWSLTLIVFFFAVITLVFWTKYFFNENAGMGGILVFSAISILSIALNSFLAFNIYRKKLWALKLGFVIYLITMIKINLNSFKFALDLGGINYNINFNLGQNNSISLDLIALALCTFMILAIIKINKAEKASA